MVEHPPGEGAACTNPFFTQLSKLYALNQNCRAGSFGFVFEPSNWNVSSRNPKLKSQRVDGLHWSWIDHEVNFGTTLLYVA